MDAAEFTSKIRGLDRTITRNTVFVYQPNQDSYTMSRDRTKCSFNVAAPSFECVRRPTPRWYCRDAGEFHVVHRKSDGEGLIESPVNRNRFFGLG
jgi:hypothetical protein